jgi:signal transduction histidine kinase
LAGLALLLYARDLTAPPLDSVAITHPAPDTWTVAGVPYGGPTWNAGVRPGMAVIGIEPATADPSGGWTSLLVTDGTVQIALQRDALPPSSTGFVGALVLLLLAGALSAWLPNLAWVLTLSTLAIVTIALAPLTDPPASLAILSAAPLAAGLYTTANPPGRRVTFAAAGMVAATAVTILSSFAVRSAWNALISLSLLVTGTVAAFKLVVVLRTAWRRAATRQPGTGLSMWARAGLALDELVPGRARTRISAIEQERERLAGELHADVLPDLSAVIRDIEAGASPAEAAQRLQAIALEVRDLMSVWRIPALDELGLVAALEWLAERVQDQTGVRVELDLAGSGPRPPREVEVALFRITQQALDNALLHARPQMVRVSIALDARHVDLELTDDGVGLSAGAEERAARAGRLGLADMRERARAIGASFSIHGEPGRGTSVVVRWPT